MRWVSSKHHAVTLKMQLGKINGNSLNLNFLQNENTYIIIQGRNLKKDIVTKTKWQEERVGVRTTFNPNGILSPWKSGEIETFCILHPIIGVSTVSHFSFDLITLFRLYDCNKCAQLENETIAMTPLIDIHYTPILMPYKSVANLWSWKKLEKSNEKQVCIPVGCVPTARWAYLPACLVAGGLLLGGVCSWGVPALGGGGGSALGGSVLGGWYPAYTEADPPVNRILDTRLWKYYLAPNFVCGR